ncbi:MAG: Rha family transcriptional regulator, partial [Comamonas sp.]
SEALTAATDRASSEKSQTTKKGTIEMNSTVVTTNAAIATPDLVVVDGQITTTSLQIAEHFGKRHKNVMQAIANLECSPEFNRLNFQPVEYLDAKGEKRPCYRITRDGFVFLAMGFTGKEAAQWKEAYITAFNKMEAELRAKEKPAADPAIDYTRISPAQAQDLREIVKAIVDAKIQDYPGTWARLQRKFRVNSYLQLPAARYEEARQYLIAKLPNGYTGEVYEENIPVERLQSALSAANAVAMQIQQAAVMAMMKSEDLRHGRWMVSFGYDAASTPSVKQIDGSSCVLPIDKFHLAIEDSIAIDPQVLMRLATTCMNKMASMATRNTKALPA